MSTLSTVNINAIEWLVRRHTPKVMRHANLAKDDLVTPLLTGIQAHPLLHDSVTHLL